MPNLTELLAGLAENHRDALRALAGHLNHDQITGTLHSLADDADALAGVLRDGEDLADATIPDDDEPNTTAAPSGRRKLVHDDPQA